MWKKLLIPILAAILIACLVLARYADHANELPEQPDVSDSASPEPTESEELKLPDIENGLGWG